MNFIPAFIQYAESSVKCQMLVSDTFVILEGPDIMHMIVEWPRPRDKAVKTIFR